MAVLASDVKRLREITGVGMMDCKRALTEADGDIAAAVELLRKKGQKVAAKRAGREANEGIVVSALSSDGGRGVLVEVNCETDFVARNEDFQRFARDVAGIVLNESPADIAALKVLRYRHGRSVEQAIEDLTGKIGEKIDVRRFAILDGGEDHVISYIHPGARLGVLVHVHGGGSLQEAGTDVAMQVAAMNPIATRTEDVPGDVRAKELDIAREAARNEGKPAALIDRIAAGKLKRFFKDHVLLEQPFVKDSSMTVKEMLREADADVRGFVRFTLAD